MSHLQSITWQRHRTALITDSRQILEASASRLSKHRNRCFFFFSFLRQLVYILFFTIRYAGEFVQNFAESHVLIFHVSMALPRLRRQRTFHWLPESPENNYHQHPANRLWTRKPPPRVIRRSTRSKLRSTTSLLLWNVILSQQIGSPSCFSRWICKYWKVHIGLGEYGGARDSLQFEEKLPLWF